MINEESLKKYCAKFNEKDSQIIFHYFHFTDILYPFSEYTECKCKSLLSSLLLNKHIENFSYNYLCDRYKQLTDTVYKKQFILFVFFLCHNKYLLLCPFYRLLPLKNKLSSNELIYHFNYWLNLEDKYYNSLVNSDLLDSHTNSLSDKLLFFELDENEFKDKDFYVLCKNKIETLKIITSIENEPLLEGLRILRKQLYYIGKILPIDFNQSNFITVITTKWGNNHYLYNDLFELLDIAGYLHDSLLLETVQLLTKVHKEYNKDYYYLVSNILASGKPLNWIMVHDKFLYYFNCSNTTTLEILKLYSTQNKSKATLSHYIAPFLKYFDCSLSCPKASLSFKSYLEQINFFNSLDLFKSSRDKQEIISVVHSFYTFYQTYQPNVFTKDGYSTALLKTISIAQLIANGYLVVNYNSLAKIPTQDKWIFCYKDSLSPNIIRISRIDLTKIKNSIFRNWYKYYLWHDSCKKESILHNFKKLKDALNYITELKDGTILSFYTRERNTNYDDINLQELIAFKMHIINNYSNNRTRAGYIYSLKNMLKFISNSNIHKFRKDLLLELTLSNINSYSQKPIPLEHLKVLIDKVSEKAQNCIEYQLYYVIFYISIETSFRANQILNLKIDCVKPTAKNNEYVLHSETKTSNKEEIEQPISIYVKRCIDEAIRLTSEFRSDNTYEELNQNLFIIPTKLKKNCYHVITKENFNTFLHEICDEINIPEYTFQNLRDFHMTMAEEYIIRRQLSDSQLKILTHHKSTQTTIQHYSKPSITEILESVNGVIIGDVDIKGQIINKLPKEINEKSDLVSEECGYCSSKTCTCFTDIDCLLCEHFVTTFSRIPYFNERLEMINRLIPLATYPHDKDDLVSKKKLLLAYIQKIIEYEEFNREKQKRR